MLAGGAMMGLSRLECWDALIGTWWRIKRMEKVVESGHMLPPDVLLFSVRDCVALSWEMEVGEVLTDMARERR